MNPHRETDKPCGACAERAEHLAAMRPFQPAIERECPFCLGHQKVVFGWAIVCKGAVPLRISNGFWFLKWWGRRVLRCLTRTPHFHMRCDACGGQWTMRTAMDAKPAGGAS